MSALDKIREKKNHELDAIERLIIEAWECLDGREWMSDEAAEELDALRITLKELVALRRVAEAAQAFSVEPTIEQKTIVDEKTFVSLDVSEVRKLAAALAEYDKCRAA